MSENRNKYRQKRKMYHMPKYFLPIRKLPNFLDERVSPFEHSLK